MGDHDLDASPGTGPSRGRRLLAFLLFWTLVCACLAMVIFVLAVSAGFVPVEGAWLDGPD